MSNNSREIISYNTLLVDGNSLLKNAFEVTYKQIFDFPNIHGIYTFLMKVRNQMDAGHHDRLRIVFDGDGKGVLRKMVYPNYKISRVDKQNPSELENIKRDSFRIQKKSLQNYLSHFCLWYEDSKVEADDIMAYYVYNKLPNEKITIMTGDVDVMSLIRKDVDIHYLNKKFKTKTEAVIQYEKDSHRRHIIINHKNFKDFFGYVPENIPTIKIICGDKSDDIVGISRIGETSLIKEFSYLSTVPTTIESLLADCELELDLLKKQKEIKGVKTSKTRETLLTNIIERNTTGIQGKHIIEINKRIVMLENQEFITPRCIENIKNNGFLCYEKFKPINLSEMTEKMKIDGIFDLITKNYKDIKLFFKPFKKTLTLEG